MRRSFLIRAHGTNSQLKVAPVNRQQFTQLARRLEAYAKAHPRRYHAKVVGILILGYAYPVLMLLLLVGLLGVLVALLVALLISGQGSSVYVFVKCAIMLLLPIYALLRALFVRLSPPEGIRLQPAEAPRLFALIEKLRRSIRAPRLHRVLITGDFEACVVQHPRLGLLGWYRNYLIIGFPLIAALDPVQFEAVLAHELGHIAHTHGRLGNWIYRVRASWSRLSESFEKKRVRGAFLFQRFFRWYFPHFHAWSLIVARECEYEADRVSAALAGPEAFARALLATRLHKAYLDSKFQDEMTRRAGEGQPPPDSWFAVMSQHLRDGYATQDMEHWLGQALSQATDIHDTHPALSDRLRGLGIEPACCVRLLAAGPHPCTSTDLTAATLLGDMEPEVRRRLDEPVRAHIAKVWQDQAAKILAMRQRFEELESKAASGAAFDAAETLERTILIARTQEPAAALPLLRECVMRPDAPPLAHYRLGQMLLELENEEGLAHLEEAIRRNQEFTLPGCELAIGWLKARGRNDETGRWYERGDEHYGKKQDIARERGQVTAADRFLPHGLPAEIVAAAGASLSAFKPVKRGYLVRKEIGAAPNKPHYVVGLHVKFPRFRFQSANAAQELVHQVCSALRLPSSCIVITLAGKYQKIGKKLRKIDGALIYKR